MSKETLDPKEEALQRAAEKIKNDSVGVTAEITPSSPETDPKLQEMFPDAPKGKEPNTTPEGTPEPTSKPLPIPPLDATLGFICSIHGKQPLKELRYTTIILSCGCEWIYDCGHLLQSRRGPV